MQSQLIYNHWFGKAIGVVCAFIFAPQDNLFLAAFILLGLGGGHLFDFWAGRQSTAKPHIPIAARGNQALASNNSARHLEYMFASLGRVAKTSGVVTPRHIAQLDAYINELGFSDQGRQQAIRWFELGKDPSFNLQKLAKKCLGREMTAECMRTLTLTCLCQLAAMKPTDQTLTAVLQLTGWLNLPASLVANKFGKILHRANKDSQKAQPKKPAAAQPRTQEDVQLDTAYTLLDVSKGSSQDVIKKAYRRLVNKHHPDKLGPDATAAAIAEAHEIMVELRNALEVAQKSS